jgi:hypothetical protein
MEHKTEKKYAYVEGGGVPLTLATAQPAPHAHMAVPECSLCGQAIAVSAVTPSAGARRPATPRPTVFPHSVRDLL